MPDVERDLREEFVTPDGDEPWEADPSLVARGRRRRRRRSSVGGLFALLIVAALAAVVVSMIHTRSATPEASRTPAPTGPTLSPAEARLDQLAQRLPYVPATAAFGDIQRGYAVAVHCARISQPRSCVASLASTTDGGAHWVVRKLPKQILSGYSVSNLHLYPVGEGLVVEQTGTFAALLKDGPPPTATPDLSTWVAGQRWFTPDGGRTWQKRVRAPTRTVSHVPAGGRLILPVPDPRPGPATAGDPFATSAQVLLPDGRAFLLADGPGGRAFTDSPVVTAADGGIWVPGFDFYAKPASRAQLLVSADFGRSFRPVKVPAVTEPPGVLTADGRTLFLVQYAENGTVRLQRSIDAGQSWRAVKLPPAAKVAHGPVARAVLEIVASSGGSGMSMATLPDGGLLLSNGSGLFRLSPTARAFTKVRGAPTILGLLPAGPVTLGLGTVKGAPAFFATADGKTWRSFALH